MNNSKVKEILAFIQQELSDGIVSADIFHIADGQTLGGINSNPMGSAFLASITQRLQTSIKTAGFKTLGQYYLILIDESKAAIGIPLGAFECGIMIDTVKSKMGLVISVVIPGILKIANKP